MKKTIYILSGIAIFLLLAATLPYFDIVDVNPILGWFIGLGLIFVLPVVLVFLIVISLRQITRKSPPDEDALDLHSIPRPIKEEDVLLREDSEDMIV